MRYLCMSLFLILISCTSKEPRFPVITEDYCAEAPTHNFPPLSEQFDFSIDSNETKTGVYSLEEGDMSMLYRAWLTESAEKTIDIQYFIFSGDNIGLIAVDYLLRAADRGVKVRLLVDDLMVDADGDQLLALDSHPNLSIKIYNPNINIGKKLPRKLINMTTDFAGFNERMHNKTFIVDDQIVITGGRNIADEYFDYDHEYNFRDRDTFVLGKAVTDISDSFSLFWEDDLSVPISDVVGGFASDMEAEAIMEYLRQYACNPTNFWPEIHEKIDQAPIAFQALIDSSEITWEENITFVSDIPGKNDVAGLGGGGISTDSLIALIQNADESVHIQSPYLVTTELGQNLFKEAIDRGVEITIHTNSILSTDNIIAFSGYKKDRQTLLDIGVNIYEYRPDAAIRYEMMNSSPLQRKMNFTPIFGLHAKTMVVDSKIAVIGTFNLDPRSANLNTECIVIIRNDEFATQLYDIMKIEILPENAWHVTSDFNPDNKASILKRFKIWTRGIVPEAVL